MQLRPFLLERYFARHEFSARYLLGSSDPEPMTVAEVLAYQPEARGQLEALSLGYTETAGHPELRAAIAALYRVTSPEQVLVFCGAEEPIFTFMNVVLRPGDHAIVQWPGYQSHYAIAQDLGAEVSLWKGDPARGWRFDVAALEAMIRPSTKLLLVSSPHNPTGAHFTQAEWLAVIELARRHGLWLFADEVYRGLEHDAADRLPSACDLYERGVSVNGTSKSYGLAGLRIGWLATADRALLAALAAFKDYVTISNAAPSELLATIAVRHSAALWARHQARLAHHVQLLDAFLTRHARHFAWTRPRAGTTALVRYLGGSATELAERVVRDHGVMLVPSPHFECGDGHLRFGYGRANFPEALAALAPAL